MCVYLYWIPIIYLNFTPANVHRYLDNYDIVSVEMADI